MKGKCNKPSRTGNGNKNHFDRKQMPDQSLRKNKMGNWFLLTGFRPAGFIKI
jgi:hypothetical protein